MFENQSLATDTIPANEGALPETDGEDLSTTSGTEGGGLSDDAENKENGTAENENAADENQDGEKEGESTEAVSDDSESEDDNLITIRYNHETLNLTPDEAAVLAQKGKAYEKISPVLSELELAAERTGLSISDLVKEWVGCVDKAALEDAIEKSGGDSYAGNQLYTRQLEEARQKVKTRRETTEQENSISEYNNNRLAEDFEKYRGEMGVKEISELPKAVIKTAVKENIPLFDAFLRFEHKNKTQIDKNKQKQKQNSAAAPTSLESGGDKDDFSTASAALLNA